MLMYICLINIHENLYQPIYIKTLLITNVTNITTCGEVFFIDGYPVYQYLAVMSHCEHVILASVNWPLAHIGSMLWYP